MKEIKLTQNRIALVDDEDFEYLNQFKWCAHKTDHTYYACRNIRIEGKKSQAKLYMHSVIMGTPTGFETDHINHNGLDNQRANLRIVTHRENSLNVPKNRIVGKNCLSIHMENISHKDYYIKRKSIMERCKISRITWSNWMRGKTPIPETAQYVINLIAGAEVFPGKTIK